MTIILAHRGTSVAILSQDLSGGSSAACVMAAALRYLSTTNAEGNQVRTAALWIRPASRQRCLIALPKDVVDDLALSDHLVSVAAANGAGTVEVGPVLVSASAEQVPGGLGFMREQLRQLAAVFGASPGAAARPPLAKAAVPAGSGGTAPQGRAARLARSAAVAPEPPMGTDDLRRMMWMTMLSKEMKTRPKKGSGDGSFEDDEEGPSALDQDRTTKAFARYTAYEQATRARPAMVLEQYREHVKEELDIRAGEHWSFRDWWKAAADLQGHVRGSRTERRRETHDDTGGARGSRNYQKGGAKGRGKNRSKGKDDQGAGRGGGAAAAAPAK
jgi:hypothetical protein